MIVSIYCRALKIRITALLCFSTAQVYNVYFDQKLRGLNKHFTVILFQPTHATLWKTKKVPIVQSFKRATQLCRMKEIFDENLARQVGWVT